MSTPRELTGKDIAFRDGARAEESLPYRIVWYPGHYGIFFAFSPSAAGPPVLCECSRLAAERYLRTCELRASDGAGDLGQAIDERAFPFSITQLLRQAMPRTAEQAFQALAFAPALCHACNSAVPSLRYCHPMYGGPFQQNFGWYVNMQACEWGVVGGKLALREWCPPDLRPLFPDDDKAKWLWQQPTSPAESEAKDAALEVLHQRYRAQHAAVENHVRRKLGYGPIGSAFVCETAVYQIVARIFSGLEVLRNQPCPGGGRMTFDVSVPALSLAVEYQGVQHFEPVKRFGGKEGLVALQARDKLKRELACQAGVRLVYVAYDEPLEESFVSSRIEAALGTAPG